MSKVRRGTEIYVCPNRNCVLHGIALVKGDEKCPECFSVLGHMGWATSKPNQYIPAPKCQP